MGLWNYDGIPVPQRYGDETTYRLGFAMLDGCATVEDWGCGTAYGRRFCTGAYKGIDGSPSQFTGTVADLREYRSEADGIFLRHVLEHNEDWALILAGAVASFRRRLVVIIFTPFGDETRVLGAPSPIPDISFRKADLTALMEPFLVAEKPVETGTWYGAETIFLCERQ